MSPRYFDSRSILGQRVDCTDYDSAVEFIINMTENGRGGYVCCSTVNMVMSGHDDPNFRRIVNSADLITPDGMPLVWGLRLQGIRRATQVKGPSLTPILCREAANRDIPVGFYGTTEETLELMQIKLRKENPNLNIAYVYSPPFRQLTSIENEAVIREILASGVKILFIGLGTPKQISWMAQHKERLPNIVMLGVGAAFDFIAGVKPIVPLWMEKAGLEWFFRLLCEPRRLWRRYVYYNPRFMWQFGLQMIGLKDFQRFDPYYKSLK